MVLSNPTFLLRTSTYTFIPCGTDLTGLSVPRSDIRDPSSLLLPLRTNRRLLQIFSRRTAVKSWYLPKRPESSTAGTRLSTRHSWLADELSFLSRARSISLRCSRLPESFKLKGRCSKPRRENVYLLVWRLAKRRLTRGEACFANYRS